MKVFLAASLIQTMLAELATAGRDCYNGYVYCGHSLKDISKLRMPSTQRLLQDCPTLTTGGGGDAAQGFLEDACEAKGKSCLGDKALNHLFKCELTARGLVIREIRHCNNGCADRGFGKDDGCGWV